MAQISHKPVVRAIKALIADGTLRKGYPMPPADELAVQLGCTETQVQNAYAELHRADMISGINKRATGTPCFFAGSWQELSDPSFEVPDELAMMSGRMFSYRSEVPNEPMPLKVTYDVMQRRESERKHRHDFHELVLVTGGSGVHVHGRERYPVFGGDCFVVMPGEGHGFVTDSTLELVNVIFYSDVLSPHFGFFREIPGFLHLFSVEPLFRKEAAFRHKLHLTVAQRKKAQRMADGIARERSESEPGFRIAALTRFYELVVFLSRLYGAVGRREDQARELAGSEQVVSRVIAMLQERSTEDLSVSDLARHVFLSTSRLQHILKETLGTSFSDCLLSIRIEHASALLVESDAPVHHIAAQVGFHDRGYFSRMFKRTMGESPAQYRKTHRTPLDCSAYVEKPTE